MQHYRLIVYSLHIVSIIFIYYTIIYACANIIEIKNFKNNEKLKNSFYIYFEDYFFFFVISNAMFLLCDTTGFFVSTFLD